MDLEPLFETIVSVVPAPVVEDDAPFQMLVTTLDYDDYKGKYAIGRITRGRVRPGMAVAHLSREGDVARGRIGQVFTWRGLGRIEVEEASAGDIVALTGIADANISDTIADFDNPEALPTLAIEEPTLKMTLASIPARSVGARASLARHANCARGSIANSKPTSACGSRMVTPPMSLSSRDAANCTFRF